MNSENPPEILRDMAVRSGEPVDHASFDAYSRYCETPVHMPKQGIGLTRRTVTMPGHGLRDGEYVKLKSLTSNGPSGYYIAVAVRWDACSLRRASRWEVSRYRVRAFWGRVCRSMAAQFDAVYTGLRGLD